jgi:hypothetical protein
MQYTLGAIVNFFVCSSDLEKMQFYIQKDIYQTKNLFSYICQVGKWHLNSANP